MAQINFKAIAAGLENEAANEGGKVVSLDEFRTDRGRGIGMEVYLEEGKTYTVPTLEDLKFIETTTNKITATFTRLADENGQEAKVFSNLFDRSCFRLEQKADGFYADRVVPTQLTGAPLIPARATRAECWQKVAGHSFKVVKVETVKALGFKAGSDGKNMFSVKKGQKVSSDPEAVVDAKIYTLELIA